MSYFSRKEQSLLFKYFSKIFPNILSLLLDLNIGVTMLSLNWRGITEDLKQRLIILKTICCNSMLSTGVRNIE
ncbi:unnamed protein product [Acanthoscelides obtectus]|uniref:Uncharacterized protein n=2 Tax=Acanthoscelides obtectus TaxID=200917 RepID=A0A9P0KIA5_ACAOB|nr:unnamed protein product [Acanthoscelides obtectus]CAK1656697.1 hypothetical protein AOBTE_LOCUS19870 [Acanthoscelides obtectus]